MPYRGVDMFLRCMRPIVMAMMVFLSFVPAVRAQDDLAGRISCHRAGFPEVQNQAYKSKLWDGYEISLGPARNGTEDGNGCTAAIYNRDGHVVFRTTGFRVVFDQNHTGRDFDGDGKPEVVFITDTGGGMHCCWAYNVISLFPKPRLLFDLPFPARFEKDKLGKMLIWENIPGLSGLTTNAGRPGAQKVFRVNHGRLLDTTIEFCPEILSSRNEAYDEESRTLTPEKVKALRPGSEPDDETASALLSLALQHTFCKQFDKALYYLNLWPESTGNPETSRKKVTSAFAESIKQEFPAFAARLVQLSESVPAKQSPR